MAGEEKPGKQQSRGISSIPAHSPSSPHQHHPAYPNSFPELNKEFSMRREVISSLEDI